MEYRVAATALQVVSVMVSCALCGANAARAQDMVFGVEGAAQGPAPPGADAPPSEALVRALAHYRAERFAQAAVLLQRVLEGGTSDAPARVRQAEFFLAKALFHLGFDHASLRIIDEIAERGVAHPYFANTPPWLARLAERLPGSDAVRAVAGRLSPAGAGLPPSLLFVVGRRAYEQGELELALRWLSKIEVSSPRYLEARLLSGVAQVRRRRARPAIAAFREIVRRVDAGETGGAADAARLQELALLSLGRVYYTAAHGGGAHSGRMLGNAVESWSRVEQRSEYWLDALFESAWALFVADQHARALGNLHALLSPYFPGAFYPEAHLLKAVIFFDSCQMTNARAALSRFHSEYDPIRDELSELLARDSDGEAVFALITGGGARRAALSRVLRGAFGERSLARVRAELDAISTQENALGSTPEALRASSLGARIREDLAVARALAQGDARELARVRAERLLSELREAANQADTVEIEILNYERGNLGAAPHTVSAEGRSVHVDSEHVLWPFDGEYWRDELGYYRQQVTNRCRPR